MLDGARPRGQAGPALGEYAKTEEWEAARDEIRDAVLERGWSKQKQAFAQSFDSDELDAAQLLMPILGFLPATDERMRSTIEAIASDLTEDGLVLRYRNDEGLNADGLTGEEGTFVICSFWLVSCLAKAGELERAEALFEQLAGYANDLGLLAEEIDTANGEQLGNFPQAFSHIGLITAAWEIDKARRRGRERPLRRCRNRGRARGRALRRPPGRGRPARGDRGARAGRWRVRLLGVHPVEDPAALGRGAAGGARSAGRARGGERRSRRQGAFEWRDFMVSGYEDGVQGIGYLDSKGIEVLRGPARLAGPGQRRGGAATPTRPTTS